MKKFRKIVNTICISSIFYTSSAVSQVNDNPSKMQNNNNIVLLTPFSNIKKSSDDAIERIPINTYTRLEIKSHIMNTQATPRNGKEVILYSKRNILRRLGGSKKYVANATLSVEAGIFNDAVTLIGREYESSSKVGERFARIVNYDKFSFPDFLITSNIKSRIGKFELNIDVDEANNSNIASLSLATIESSLKAVAPSSGLVTKVSKESADNLAANLDSAFGQFFATGVSEKTRFDIQIDTGKDYIISIYGPTYETDELGIDKLIGQWTVQFATARPSIFSNIECAKGSSKKCEGTAGMKTPQKQAFDQATADIGSVLNFELIDKVGDAGKLSAYLRQQEWWVSSLSLITSGENTHGEFCKQISLFVTGLGFSGLDGRIVANSVARSALVKTDIGAGMLADPNCNFSDN